MTTMKSSVKNLNPHPQSLRYKESEPSSELVNSVRKEIREWPEELQNLLDSSEGEVDDNELVNIFQDLLKLRSKVLEANYSEKYYRLVVLCLNYLQTNAPYLQKYRYRYIPEGANVSELSFNDSVNTSANLEVVKTSSFSWCFFSVLTVLLAVLAVCIGIYYSNTPDNTGVGPNKIDEWAQNIKKLQKQFPSQSEKIWVSIMSGVKTIVTETPSKPSVLLLLHNDKKTSVCLANQVGKEAVKLLSDKQSQEPIIIQGEDLKLNDSLTKDYGLFSESYKHDIENVHVMIVHDLQEVPARIAQTFHVLCDVENPLVRNAAFLFTMQVDEKEDKKPTKIAEEYLAQLWKGKLSNDIMDPLITRITDAVESVKMESGLRC